jgi:hypothetical protein
MTDSAEELRHALGHLLQWANGNRGNKDCNPYAVPEVREALKALARSKGWSEERIKKGYYDAADEYRLVGEVATKLTGRK